MRHRICWKDDKEEGYLGTGGEHWADEAGKCNLKEKQSPHTRQEKGNTPPNVETTDKGKHKIIEIGHANSYHNWK